jgi:small subunit ribosomal protein S15
MPDIKTTERPAKQAIIEQHRTHSTDTGSCEVQIAILSERIAHLTNHLRINRKDIHSRRGLIQMTSRRRKLLDYLKKHEFDRYSKIIQTLGLRR